MSDRTEQTGQLSPIKRALLEIRELRAKLDAVEQNRREPVAIVGMGCRFPGGVQHPEAYWQLLQDGVDAISEVPPQRWDVDALYDPDPDAAGKTYARWGGFLDDVDRFDAGFFSIAPREATSMDPQQRLLLEVAWEALEDAGLPLEHLAGTKTGVFVGICRSEYGALRAGDLPGLDIYSGTGTYANAAAGRLAYLWDLQGPCVAIDTACSSSLVAIHLACQSLHNRECTLALAGGVNLILSPGLTIVLSRMRGLSRDGRCKAFDSRADGFVSSEGCGMLVLKRLSDALADGDRILALIRGSAINQDGKSAGLTAPNGAAQQAVIRQALANAGITPDQISYVETHGTGTVLGDPIEVDALAAIFGKPSTAGLSCALGSVKTNIGHLEAAAGVAGLMKVVLALQYGAIPPHLHLQMLNPNITLQGTRLTIPTTLERWEGPRIAGVSSFGWSGTNVHMILQSAPAPAEAAPAPANSAYLLPLSAKSAQALRALARRYQEFLPDAARPTPLRDICYTASIRRSHHPYRMAVAGQTPAELVAALEAAMQQPDPTPTTQPPRVVFVFPGQGSQWLGMGRQLLEQEPVFREMIERCEAAFQPYVDWSLREQLTDDTASVRLADIGVIQPTLFAMQVALAALWQSWGINPAAVIGHSMGEVAAACVAGALRLEDAARVICTRSALLRRVRGQGAMAVVELPWEGAQQAIAGYEDRLSVAVSNSPRSTVLSGDAAALEQVLTQLSAQGIFCRSVKVDVASHSPQMNPLLPDLEAALAGLTPRAGPVPIYSAVLVAVSDGSSYDAAYWVRNLRAPVQFAAATQQALADGHTHFIEISPNPILVPAIEETLRAAGHGGQALPSLRREQNERATLLESLGRLYASGCAVDWQRLYPHSGRCVALPGYPWQRKRYWLETAVSSPLAGYHEMRHNGAAHLQEEAYTNWLYRPTWEALPLATRPGGPTQQPGTWLLFADAGGIAASLQQALEARGNRCVLLQHGATYEQQSPSVYQLPGDDPSALRDILARVLAEPGFPCRGIVHLWSLDAPPAESLSAESLGEAQQRGCLSVLLLVQTLVTSAPAPLPRLVLVTREAQAPAATDTLAGLAQTPLWGLGRVIQNEHPELRCSLVDLDQQAASLQGLVQELTAAAQPEEVALRGGQRFVARLVPHRPPLLPPPTAPRFAADATYLITGGLGGIGLAVAGWLVRQGARHLVLVGRRAPAAAVQPALRALQELGAQVVVQQADVASEEQVQALLDYIDGTMPPLRGVFHAAGVARSALLLDEEPSQFESVLAPKVGGAWALHRLTQQRGLDFLVLFSSTGAVLVNFGQSSYGAANAFLDGLAHYRQHQQQPTLSINWGLWENTGMTANLAEDLKQYLTQYGFQGMTSEQALQALQRLLDATLSAQGAAQPAQVVVAPMDWQQVGQVYQQRTVQPLLSHLVQPPDPDEEQAAAAPVSLRDDLQALPARQRRPRLAAYLLEQLAQVLHCAREELAPETPLSSLGLDSLMALEFRNRIERGVGLALSATLIWTYPTIEAIADHLIASLDLAPEVRTEPAPMPPATTSAEKTEPDELAHLDDDELLALIDALREEG